MSAHSSISSHRPNGPADPSPGLRPQADALGQGPSILRPIGPREPAPRAEPTTRAEALAALQAAVVVRFSPQGVGLRPQPWAKLCRPVGPVGPVIRVIFAPPPRSFSSRRSLFWMSLLVRSGGEGESRPGVPRYRPLEAIDSELYATGGLNDGTRTVTADEALSRARARLAARRA